MHRSEEEEEADRAQCLTGSQTEWLEALSPICS